MIFEATLKPLAVAKTSGDVQTIRVMADSKEQAVNLEIEMAENMSLADQAVNALAMVRAMDEGLDMEQPERHAIRNLKHIAEYALTDAFRLAQDLSFQAQDLRKLAREIESADKPHNV